jgi:hypothetical protein
MPVSWRAYKTEINENFFVLNTAEGLIKALIYNDRLMHYKAAVYQMTSTKYQLQSTRVNSRENEIP